MRRFLALIGVLAATACGGGDSTQDETTTSPAVEDTVDESGSDPGTATTQTQEGGEADQAAGPEAGTATVTIGDETLEFTEQGFCTGSVLTFNMPGNTQFSVSIVFPPPAVEVNDPDGPDWIADSERTGFEESSVDSFTSEGGPLEGGTPIRVSGTATFTDGTDLVDGSFEAMCSE